MQLSGQSEDTIAVDEPRAKIFDFTLDAVMPVQTFNEKLGKDMFGFTMAYYVERKSKNYDFWGFQFDYGHLGSRTNRYLTPANQGIIEVDERTGSNFVGLHFMYRYYTPFFFWKIEPFAEAALGTKMFYTNTTRNFFDEEGSSDFDFDEFDMNVSYGVGIGFTAQLSGQFFFITKMHFYSGNSLSYLVPKDGDDEIPINNFFTETTQTNLVRLQFGVSYTFF
ncbi:MAG: hypothetical protein HKO89_06005 [Saprospiraceae bacterium]|nr:hypothetical protein [Saprospiraceae bacterium]